MSKKTNYNASVNKSSCFTDFGGKSRDNSVLTTSPVSEEDLKDFCMIVEKPCRASEDERKKLSENFSIHNNLFNNVSSRKSIEDCDIRKNQNTEQFKKSSLYCGSEQNTEEFQDEIPEVKEHETHVQDWHVRQWNSELRENDLFMDEQNLERKKTKLKKFERQNKV